MLRYRVEYIWVLAQAFQYCWLENVMPIYNITLNNTCTVNTANFRQKTLFAAYHPTFLVGFVTDSHIGDKPGDVIFKCRQSRYKWLALPRSTKTKSEPADATSTFQILRGQSNILCNMKWIFQISSIGPWEFSSSFC